MPTITIPDKICPHCGDNKWYISKESIKCAALVKEYHKKYREGTGRIYLADWKIKNLKKIEIHRNNWRYNNPNYAKDYYDKTKGNQVDKKRLEATTGYRICIQCNKKKNIKKFRLNSTYSYSKTCSVCYSTNKYKRDRDGLKDTYIKMCILQNRKDISRTDLTPELIELKRKQLKLIRDVRQKNKTNN